MTQKRYFKFIKSPVFRTVVLAGAAFSLSMPMTACTSITGPTSVPTGYTYHYQKVRTPEGKKAIFKTWEEWADVHQPMHSSEVPANVAVASPPMAMSGPDPVYSMDGMSAAPPAVVMTDSAPAASMASMGDVSQMDALQWQVAARDLVGRATTAYGLPSASVYVQPITASAPRNEVFEQALKASMYEQGWNVSMGPGPGTLSAGYVIGRIEDGRTVLSLVVSGEGIQPVEISGIYSVMADGMAMSMEAPMDSSVYIAPEFQQSMSMPGDAANTGPMMLK